MVDPLRKTKNIDQTFHFDHKLTVERSWIILSKTYSMYQLKQILTSYESSVRNKWCNVLYIMTCFCVFLFSFFSFGGGCCGYHDYDVVGYGE